MKLWILSDLHLDHHGPRVALEPPEHDVMICAGDVRNELQGSVETLLSLTDRDVMYVAGNHEFYGFEGRSLDEAYEQLRDHSSGSGVRLLQHDEIVIEGVRFLGCTLWTDYLLFGEDHRAACMHTAQSGLNDHRAIRFSGAGESAEPFRPIDAAEAHSASRLWLHRALTAPHDGPTVVVTHHAPHRGSVAPQFADDLLSAAFVSHMPEFFEEPHAPDLWFHGHTHVACDYQIGKYRVICNPMGYPHEYTGAPLDFVIDLDPLHSLSSGR